MNRIEMEKLCKKLCHLCYYDGEPSRDFEYGGFIHIYGGGETHECAAQEIRELMSKENNED